LGDIEGISFPRALAKKPIVDVWSAWKTASIFIRNDKDLPTKMKYREHAVVLDVDALSKVLKVACDICMEWTDFICSITGVTKHAPVDGYAVERFYDTALRKVMDVIAGSAKRNRPTKEGPVGFAAPDCARMLEVDGGKIGIRAKVVVTFQQLKEQVVEWKSFGTWVIIWPLDIHADQKDIEAIALAAQQHLEAGGRTVTAWPPVSSQNRAKWIVMSKLWRALDEKFSMVERDICAVKPGPDSLHNVTDSVEREHHSEEHFIRQEKKRIGHKSNKADMSVNSSAEPRTTTKIDGTQEEMFYKMDYFNVEDVEEVIERWVPRVFRDRSTPFEVLSDEEFRRRYRFTRHGFFSILRMMGEEFKHGTRRHNYHSLNVSCIVDDKCRFLWFSAKWPGSTHDSYAFRQSDIHRDFVSGRLRGRLVGDSAYRAEEFLIKPVIGSNLYQQGGIRIAEISSRGKNKIHSEENYNRAVCGFRVCVERSFGQLKRQFSALSSGLRYDPVRASRIIAAAICLRNTAITLNEPEPELDDDVPLQSHVDDGPEDVICSSSRQTTTQAIIANYF
uniref:DDE Tnp4 domain-containing protein n=1 Tax=Heligmosomoides polygyrus TaxID=6339 RepID=A0A8L8JWG3_HELPZ